MPRRDDLITPGPLCAPCVKEEICGAKAQAAIRAGHALMARGAWTEGEARRWNESLDRFIAETDLMLKGKLLAAAAPAE